MKIGVKRKLRKIISLASAQKTHMQKSFARFEKYPEYWLVTPSYIVISLLSLSVFPCTLYAIPPPLPIDVVVPPHFYRGEYAPISPDQLWSLRAAALYKYIAAHSYRRRSVSIEQNIYYFAPMTMEIGNLRPLYSIRYIVLCSTMYFYM